MSENTTEFTKQIKHRFDGFLPIVIDVETAGCDPRTHALLEIAAVLITMDEQGTFHPGQTFTCHVTPFEKARFDEKALKVNGIDPFHPFRFAIDELKAITQLFDFTREAIKRTACRRAVLVGHNAHFDLSFIQAAAKRCKLQSTPFHAFTCYDTATLGGFVYGKSVLAKALKAAKIPFDKEQAHSALYDAKITTELFCLMLNAYRDIPLPQHQK